MENVVNLAVKTSILIKDKIDEFKYNEGDIRKSVFNNINTAIITSGMSLKIICIALDEVDNKKFDINSDKQYSEYTYNLDLIMRLSLISIIHFQVDNFIKRIIEQIPELKVSDNFSENVKKMKEELHLTQQNEDILMTFTKMRNSLHNNGIHNKDKYQTTIKNRNFIFEKDKNVVCSSWEELFFLLDLIVCDVMPSIIGSDKISKIDTILDTTYIPNKFM